MKKDFLFFIKYLIVIFCFSIGISNIYAQSVISANNSKITYKPLKSKLISSSKTSNYKFYDPFVWGKVNANYDIFSYDKENRKMIFSIEQIGSTGSFDKNLYFIFRGIDVEYITVQDGYTGSKQIVSDYENITLPSNSILGAISSASGNLAGEADVLFKAYKVGPKKWGNNIMVEVKLSSEIKNDFIITAISKNPNKLVNLTNDVAKVVYAPLNTIFRLLGESDNSYMSFVSHKVFIPSENNTVIPKFILTKNKYSGNSNINMAVQNEYGDNYRVADWNDIVKYSGSIQQFVKSINLEEYKSAFVTFNGNRFWSSKRQYFISYHNHNKPSGYLAHENIDNYYISLGSWYNVNAYILCVRK